MSGPFSIERSKSEAALSQRQLSRCVKKTVIDPAIMRFVLEAGSEPRSATWNGRGAASIASSKAPNRCASARRARSSRGGSRAFC
ncbi:protein of unknown function [Hyphomicrobium sp. 1Nfss2.1]